MTKKILFFVILILGAGNSMQTFAQGNFKTLKAEAYKLIEAGNYKSAISKLKECEALEPENNEIKIKLAESYLQIPSMRQGAVPILEKISKTSSDPNTIYKLGIAYHSNERFQEAIDAFTKYSELTRNTGIYELEAKKHKLQCKVGRQVFSTQGTLFENLGATFNTAADEWNPVLNSDDTQILFASNRAGATGGKQNSKLKADESGSFYADIYYSAKVDGGWNVPKNAGDKVNTNNHEIPLRFLPGDQMIYFSKIEGKSDVNIYQIKYQAQEWGTTEKLEEPIYSNYFEGACSVTPDGKNLYFVSSRPGGIGGKDIYVSFKAPNGKWSEPKNLGPTINSPYDEESPFITKDGILYFTSNGNLSMGGYDVLSTKFVNGAWMPPSNMGYGINTVDDEEYVSLSSADPTLLYFSSNRINSIGGQDLYSAKLNKKEDVLALQKELNENTDKTLASNTNTEAELAAKKAAEEKAKIDAELAAKKAAEEKAKLEAELAAKKATEEKAKLEAELAAKKATEEKAKIEAELAAKKTAEEKAKLEAELATKKAAEEKAKLEAELAAKKATEEKAKIEAELAAKRTTEEKAKIEAELAAKKAAEEKAKIEAEIAAKKTAEEKAKIEAELAAKKAAEEKAKIEAELAAKKTIEEKVKTEEELAAKKAAEEKAKIEAELAAKKAAEENEAALLEKLLEENSGTPIDTVESEFTQAELDSLFNSMNTENTTEITDAQLMHFNLDSISTKVDSIMLLIEAQSQLLASTNSLPKPKPLIRINNIYYEYNQSKLTEESIKTLQQLELTMKFHKDLIIGLMGHTDSRGSNEYNTELAQRRVLAIRNFLIEKGIAAEKIKVLGFGEHYPYALNAKDTVDLSEGRAANRHVEVRLLNPDTASVRWLVTYYPLPADLIIKDRSEYEKEFQGLIYRVEILQSKNPVDPKLIKGLDKIYTEGVNANTTAYLTGKYKTLEEAEKAVEDVKYKKQIKTPIVVAYYNGVRINMKKAMDIEKSIVK